LGGVGGSALFGFALALLAGFALCALLGQLRSWRRISSAWRRASSSRRESSRSSLDTAGSSTAAAAWDSAVASAPSSRWMNVRFLRTSTWMVRALPVASACLISVVDLVTA